MYYIVSVATLAVLMIADIHGIFTVQFCSVKLASVSFATFLLVPSSHQAVALKGDMLEFVIQMNSRSTDLEVGGWSVSHFWGKLQDSF